MNSKIFGTRKGVTYSCKVKPKHTKRSLIQCECCKQMRHSNEVKHFSDLPTVYICSKCLKESEDKNNG
jgi:hypothetical protein